MNTYTPDSNKIVHNIDVDFKRREIIKPIHLVQYDDSLPILAVSLYSDGQIYTIPDSADVSIRLGKSDKTYVYNKSLGYNQSKNIAYFEITQQMAALNGDVKAVVEVAIGGEVASSSYILFMIDRNPVQEDMIESTDEFTTIVEMKDISVKSANAAKVSETNAKESETNAKESETNAKESETKATESETKAKESETKAKESETNAKVSETNAKVSETNAATSATNALNAFNEISAMDVGKVKEDLNLLDTKVTDVQSNLYNKVNNSYLGINKKNLLPNTGKSITNYGVTYTVNDDMSVTVNGKAISDLSYTVHATGKSSFTNTTVGSYIFNGCPSGGSKDTYYMKLNYFSSETYGPIYDVYDIGEGVQYSSIDSPFVSCSIIIKSGTTVNNLTFYPMIRLASEEDATYEPYNLVNRTNNQIAAIHEAIDNFYQSKDSIAVINSGQTLPSTTYIDINIHQRFHRFFGYIRYLTLKANATLYIRIDAPMWNGSSEFGSLDPSNCSEITISNGHFKAYFYYDDTSGERRRSKISIWQSSQIGANNRIYTIHNEDKNPTSYEAVYYLDLKQDIY